MLVLSDSVRERVPANFEQNGANCFPLIIRAWCSEMTGWLAAWLTFVGRKIACLKLEFRLYRICIAHMKMMPIENDVYLINQFSILVYFAIIGWGAY